jgi:Rieske Fe-S protein
MKPSKLIFFLIIVIEFPNFYSCTKDKENEFPNVPVNFTINLMTDPEYIMLQAQGNSQLISYYQIGYTSLGYGNNGVIVCNVGGGEFYSFDATCPYDLPEIIAVNLSETEGVAVCPKCESRYLLAGLGMPTVKGPSEFPLHEYNTYYNPNNGELTVMN